jgi:hypothetical protein
MTKTVLLSPPVALAVLFWPTTIAKLRVPPVAVAVLFAPMAIATEPLSEVAAVPITDLPLMDTLTLGLVAGLLVDTAAGGAAARAALVAVAVRFCTFATLFLDTLVFCP